MANKIKWVRIGDFISPRNERNNDLRYGIDLIEGVNSNGEFQPTKAITDGIDLKPYKTVWPGDIVYNPSRLNIGSLAYKEKGMCIVSHLYQVFHIKETYKNILLPEYLLIWFKRKEFSRIVDYYNYGSQRAEFNLKKLGELIIPLPPISEQHKAVNAWKAFREIKEQNEAKAEPLMQVCQSFIQELKHKYPLEIIGPHLNFFREKNKDREITLEQGINISKEFISPQRTNSDLSSRYKVRTGQFAYCTQLNNENVAIAYRTGPDCVVSPVYEVFEIKEKSKSILLPEYLFLWLIRPEFGRYVYWSSVGSAYEFLRFDNLYTYKIAFPPIEVQQAIVNIYKCANEAKQIAAEADRLSKEVCPALIQHLINN